jgi:hypothetical protein
MIETRTPGIKAQEAVISPACRANRGVEGAIDEALRRIKEEYMKLQIPVNENAKFHVVLTVDRPKP